MSNVNEPLTNPRWEQFARLIAAGATLAEAYVSVGYSEKGAAPSAARLLRNANVSERISHLKRESSTSAITNAAISKEWVLAKLRYVVEQALDSENRLDSPVRALELLGKELGMFKERLEMSGAVVVDPGREAVPDAVLDAMIAQAQLQAGQPKQIEETVQ